MSNKKLAFLSVIYDFLEEQLMECVTALEEADDGEAYGVEEGREAATEQLRAIASSLNKVTEEIKKTSFSHLKKKHGLIG